MQVKHGAHPRGQG